MKQVVKKYLREQLANVESVQRCTLVPPASVAGAMREADITVLTWLGIVIHIHLIDEPIKPPRLRRIVEHATGAGIASLFLVDTNLLPRQGERVPVERWFLAAHALTKDRLYAYGIRHGQPVIHAVDFTTVSRTEVETRHGADVLVHHLRIFRHTVRHSAVKGYWLLADFEPEAGAKSAGFRQPHGVASPPPRPAYTSPPPRREPPPASPPPPPPTRLEHCYALLGVPRSASRDEVKAAFRRLAFEVHPDVSELPKTEAETRFKTLSEAYEFIKAANRWT